jgi:hypothetical protein
METQFLLETTDQAFVARGEAIKKNGECHHFFFRHDRELFPEITLGQFIFRVAKWYERKTKE